MIQTGSGLGDRKDRITEVDVVAHRRARTRLASPPLFLTTSTLKVFFFFSFGCPKNNNKYSHLQTTWRDEVEDGGPGTRGGTQVTPGGESICPVVVGRNNEFGIGGLSW